MIRVFGDKPSKQHAADRAACSATQPAVGAKARPCDMDEHGAAAAGDARPRVVVDLDNQIVETVVAPEPVAWFIGRPAERLDCSAGRPDPRTRRRRGRYGAPGAMSAAAAGDRPATTAAPAETDPRGVPPSPSRLFASDAGAAERNRHARTGPARSQPCDRRPGRGLTWIAAKRNPSHAVAPAEANSQLAACSCILACSTSRQTAQQNRSQGSEAAASLTGGRAAAGV